MSDDEFDNFPDEFADIQDVDWAGLLAGPSHPSETHGSPHAEPLAETSGQTSLLHEVHNANDTTLSSHYFSDNDDMDASFLAELDRVEQSLTRTWASSNTIPSGAGRTSQMVASHPSRSNIASLDQRHGNIESPHNCCVC
ncbi:hypothetical protein CPB84DRAFT_1481879 [Gymnopilus junonius]|uniref:Uncharacterized protein n=1 Tax=Gymnopilus junonius TaxID=109634 RepID=A0A9P5NJZ1_GYMJU|nr:hypothetical protein CPB84DRAFT_1481879 [Gymnopilus junonius]